MEGSLSKQELGLQTIKVYVSASAIKEDGERILMIGKIDLMQEISSEHFRMLRTKSNQIKDEISTMAYGPYDNGYLLLGMKSGSLLIFDPLTLEKLV